MTRRIRRSFISSPARSPLRFSASSAPLRFEFALHTCGCGCISNAMHIAFEHVGIPATDPVALKNWYERVLGARTIWDSGENPPAYLVAFPSGGWLEIYAANEKQSSPENNSLQGFRHLALRVDSLETAKAEAIQRGVVFTK